MTGKHILQKKKAGKILGILLALSLMLGACGQETKNPAAESGTGEQATEAKTDGGADLEGEELTLTNSMDSQKEIDDNLKKETEQGYTLESPLVVLNPYGNSPLSAVAVFTTEAETQVTVTVKGKEEKDNIEQTFEAATDHVVPIYGLYPDTANEVVIATADGQEQTVTIETDKLEFDAGEIEMTMYQEDAYQYDELTFVAASSGGIYALDSEGDIRWYRVGLGLPVKQLKNGHLIYCADTTLYGSYYKSGLIEADLLGKVYHEYIIPGGMHHDVFEMESGDLLVASDAQDFSSVEDRIVELDRETGEVVYELDMKDLIDTQNGGSMNRSDADWFHNNGIWYVEETDTILLSARHVDAIVGVNKTEKTLSFILGDPEGWTDMDESLFFTPVGDNFEWQYAQHQVSIRPDGTILMFDNGAGRTKTTKKEQEVTGDDVYSRAVAYKVNMDDMTIEQVFEYGKDRGKDWYSEWISGVICLDDDSDHMLITSGAHLYNPEDGSCDYGPADSLRSDLEISAIITELKDGESIFEIKTGTLSYRSLRLPLYADAKEHDLESEGTYLGSLGVTKEAETELNLDELTKKEMNQEWNLTYDPIRLAVTGSYSLEEGKEEAEDAYLVLKNDTEQKVYKVTQTISGKDDQKIVSMNGWVSPEGLTGQSYTISLVIGNTLYETGKKVTFQ